MPGLGQIAHCSEAIDATIDRYQRQQRALAARRATGVHGFDDEATDARLAAHIARLTDWLAQARSAHAAVSHGAAIARQPAMGLG